MYVLGVKDESAFASMYSDDPYAMNVKGFVMLLRNVYSLPVVYDSNVNTELTVSYKMGNTADMDLDAFLTLLRDKYGIEVKKQDNARMQVINFR